MTQPAPDITDILRFAADKGASDVIITVGLAPQFKLQGVYDAQGFNELGPTDTRKLMYSMMNEKQQRTFEERRELDFSFALGEKARFRVNAFMQRGHVGGVLRLIPTKIKSAQDMGLPQNVVDISNAPRGLVLVTGPTGSGKSTTLAAMIDHINTTKRLHIMTIEDPIEFMHTHKQSIINQREVGADTMSFNDALRAVLRQAPDVILVGEMRDYETIKAAVTAAETGHLVMGTLHTNSAPESIDRIVDVFPEEQQEQIRVQLANNLVAVMTQQLLPRLDGQGRILAYELLIANPAVRSLIREGKTYQITSVMQTGAREGMVTMDAFLANLYRRRVISFDVGVERAVDAKEFARLANDPSIGNAGGAAAAPAGYGSAPVQGFGTAAPTQSTGRGDVGRGDARSTSTPEMGGGGSYGRR
ncbi:PilT/PilU family type 4a pilus ATPase [Deinococcus sp. HMF7620]|uniref:PilT/PilU family type 4a pilus ATPase n=1 Tax=Deinococcus arboris TaxID=2682977 RepID=A0A7C9MA63_9DEIO|nr:MULTISPECIES: type IV pilus twitching motility protein PilT [Deinococcus]MBZ9752090.1 type IV pilus twitching motility protein PilT [Deinococcus betulae]MVN88163.1 PilT/PilU family type 4a pilus ATPase [Deinococcus arboris]